MPLDDAPTKRKEIIKIHIILDHLAAAYDIGPEALHEFVGLVRRCSRRQAAAKASFEGLQELVDDGVILNVGDDGFIPACVEETMSFLGIKRAAGRAGGLKTQEKIHKSLIQEAELEHSLSSAEPVLEHNLSHVAHVAYVAHVAHVAQEAKASIPPQAAPGKPGKKVRARIEDFPEAFRKAWAVCHPKSRERSGVIDAFKAWESTGAAKNPEKAVAAIEAVSKSYDWNKEDSKYAKGLGAWLRTGAWMDEIPVSSSQRDANSGKKDNDYTAN